MRNRTYVLKIESWNEGPAFVPTLKPKRQELQIHPALRFEFGEDGSRLRESLKPVGFYVAYSYTLFRKGQDPLDPLFAFF